LRLTQLLCQTTQLFCQMTLSFFGSSGLFVGLDENSVKSPIEPVVAGDEGRFQSAEQGACHQQVTATLVRVSDAALSGDDASQRSTEHCGMVPIFI
jgi:hypothetical protein